MGFIYDDFEIITTRKKYNLWKLLADPVVAQQSRENTSPLPDQVKVLKRILRGRALGCGFEYCGR